MVVPRQRHSTGRIVALAVASTMLLSALPMADAAFRTYGTWVGETATDKDATGLLLLTLGAAALQSNDADGSLGYNCPTATTCDPIYLSILGGATVAAGDVRLSHASLTEGRQVKTTDTDFGNALTALVGGFAFCDVYPTGGVDGLFNLGEALYIDADGALAISAGDTKITALGSSQTTGGAASFSMISATSTDTCVAGLTAIPGAYQFAAYDANGDGGYNIEDGVVLDNGDNLLNPGDTRLTPIGSTTAGTMAKLGDAFTFHSLTAIAAAAFLYNDADLGGTVGTNEVIYIDTDADALVSVNDIRIGPVTGGAPSSSGAGKQVLAADTDAGNALVATACPCVLRFKDNNANGGYDTADDLYLDMTPASATQVETGDLRMAKASTGSTGTPGTRVTATATDVGDSLTAFGAPPTVAFLDYNGGAVYGVNDVIFFDMDGDLIATPGDVRASIGQSPLGTYAVVLKDTNSEAEMCFRFTFPAADIAWVDEGNPATPDVSEAFYLDRAGDGSVSPLDVRLSTGATIAAGTFVATGDSDNNAPLTSIGGLPFVTQDANGDTVYSLGTGSNADDAVYIDAGGVGAAQVEVGDARITKPSIGTFSAGTKVLNGNNDLNLPIAALTAGFTIMGVDVDGNGNFGTPDALYINVDDATDNVGGLTTNGCATPGDVRLSGSGGGTTGGGSGGGTPPPPTSNPATISVAAPPANGCLVVNTPATVSGTANPGTTNGVANTITSIAATADGLALTVSGTTSWSATFTPTTTGSKTITATVTPSSGNAVTSAPRVVIVQASCATAPPPDGSLSQQLQTLINQNSALGNQLNSTLAQNTELSARISNLSGQLGQQSQQLTSLNSQLQQLQTENAALRAQLQAGRGNATGGNGTPGFEVVFAIAGLGAALLLRRRGA